MAKRLEEGVAGLISINKPHTDNIFSLLKRFEWRKQPLPLGKYYVYETKRGGGCGKVIGEFRVCEHTRYGTKTWIDIMHIPPIVIALGYVDADELYKYGNKKSIWANLLNGIERYDKPKERSEFIAHCSRWKPDAFDHDSCAICCEQNRFQGIKDGWRVYRCQRKLTRPPQSWCRVQEIKL